MAVTRAAVAMGTAAAGRILVGTAGWADRDLVASGWYPAEVKTAGGRLAHYAGRFGMVEADSPYYAIPSVSTTEGWVRNSPDGFVIDAKAYSLFTGQRTRVATLAADLRELAGGATWIAADRVAPELFDAAWERFHAAMDPLRRAGRLGVVLLQFPATYRPGTQAEKRVEEALERCAPLRAAVEFRHGSWLDGDHRGRVLDMLRRHEAAYVCVDMPQGHAGAMPPDVEVTADVGVVRLHGRSDEWSGGNKEERYRYDYRTSELEFWAERARALAGEVAAVHVVLNNCCAGAAQRAAEELRDLLA